VLKAGQKRLRESLQSREKMMNVSTLTSSVEDPILQECEPLEETMMDSRFER
jgi:hypothetical protein